MTKQCFFVSPIGNSDSDIRKQSDKVLKYLLKPVLDKFDIKIIRADEICSIDKIDENIFKHLHNDELAIIDITGNNTNVFLELGYRIALDKHIENCPYILIREKTNDSIPFDISTIPVNDYEFDIESVESFKAKLENIINSVDFNSAKAVKLVNAKGERLKIKF